MKISKNNIRKIIKTKLLDKSRYYYNVSDFKIDYIYYQYETNLRLELSCIDDELETKKYKVRREINIKDILSSKKPIKVIDRLIDDLFLGIFEDKLGE